MNRQERDILANLITTASRNANHLPPSQRRYVRQMQELLADEGMAAQQGNALALKVWEMEAVNRLKDNERAQEIVRGAIRYERESERLKKHLS